MKFSCVLKRFVPFFAALTIGLFVASFFVTVAMPRFRAERHGHNHRNFRYGMKMENDRLREENESLRRRIAELEEKRAPMREEFEYVRPLAVEPVAPKAPAPIPSK